MIHPIQDRERKERRDRVIEVANDRGYDDMVTQIVINNHRGYYDDDDKRFLDAIREEYQKC